MHPETISPLVISGTHALDIAMWYLEAKTPVEVYARSIDKVLGPLYKGIDATAGHDHVQRRLRVSPEYFVGAAGDVARGGL